jgi:hypothetical protein
MECEKRAEQYAERALDFLKKAKAAGFFTPEAIDEMRKDKDLDAVRERRDFRELFPTPQAKAQRRRTP